MPRAKITALNIYPVKSCRGIAVSEAQITRTGLTLDRNWLIVSDRNRFITQRELPRLSLIKTQLADQCLRLTAPGMTDLEIRFAVPGEQRQVTIWNEPCAALDEGSEAAQWLSSFIGQSVRLVRFDPRGERLSDMAWTKGVEALNLFADGFPLLVLSEASLENLNQRLSTPLPMNRFRPNLVLSGLRAHDEDRIHELFTESVCVRIVKPCARCSITTTDQATGQVLGDEPLRTLKSYRWDPKLRGVMFGQNAIVTRGIDSILRVGQELEIAWMADGQRPAR